MGEPSQTQQSVTKQSQSAQHAAVQTPSLVDSLFGWATKPKEEAVDAPDADELDSGDIDKGIYSVTLESRPFGIYLVKTYDGGKNLFCTRTLPDGVADKAGVTPQSVLIAINGESCEDLGNVEVDKRFIAAAKSTGPVNITFRKGREEEIKAAHV